MRCTGSECEREREREKRAAAADGVDIAARPKGGNGALPRGARGTMNPLRAVLRERTKRERQRRVCAPVCHPRDTVAFRRDIVEITPVELSRNTTRQRSTSRDGFPREYLVLGETKPRENTSNNDTNR